MLFAWLSKGVMRVELIYFWSYKQVRRGAVQHGVLNKTRSVSTQYLSRVQSRGVTIRDISITSPHP